MCSVFVFLKLLEAVNDTLNKSFFNFIYLKKITHLFTINFKYFYMVDTGKSNFYKTKQ